MKKLELPDLLVCSVSSDGQIIKANKFFNTFFNQTDLEAAGKDFSSFFCNEKVILKNNFPWISNSSSIYIFESRHLIDSSPRYIEWKISRDENDSFIYHAYGWDITHRKPREEELQRDQYFFHLLMDNLPDRIYFKDLLSRYIKINKIAARRRNLENPDEAIGKTDFDFFTNEHACQAFDDEKKIIRTGEILENLEEEETWVTGKSTWASTTKAPYYNEEGEIIGTFGISRDITIRKQVQQALQESESKLRELNTIKNKFFSIIAHDLRSPFSGLFGIISMLIEDLDEMDKNKIKKQLYSINGVSQQIFSLLEYLLDWGRILQNSMEFNPQPSDIVKTIKYIVDLSGLNAKNKNINLYADLPPELITSYDEKMISTVVRNLIGNAIKFTPEGGSVTINAIEENNSINVSVKDSGIGISEANIGRLFSHTDFFSTEGTSGEKGTGLGLIFCKEFVEKHNGKIFITSEINKGSTFTFLIPKDQERE